MDLPVAEDDDTGGKMNRCYPVLNQTDSQNG